MIGSALARPPEAIRAEHDLTLFANGRHPSLDDWLKRRALASEGISSRAYVICPADARTRVVGYHALATASAQRLVLPSAKLRKGMPDEIPLMLIARLAVDREWQGKRLGSMLLADALARCLRVSQIAGVRGVIAHAIDDEAASFYQAYGFTRAPFGERVMLMPIASIPDQVGRD